MLIVLAWIAGNKCYRLLYAESEEKLHRKARKLVGWAVWVSAFAAAAVSSVLLMASGYHPVFWLDRLLLHVPLLALPTVLIWSITVPRVKKLRTITGRKSDHEPDPRLRYRAADPALVFPVRLAMLSALAAFYFALSPPKQADEAVFPLLIYAVAAGIQWFALAGRRMRAGAAGARPVYRPWLSRLQALGVLAAAAALGSAPFISAMDASRLPSSLSMASAPVDYGDGKGSRPGLGHAHGSVAATAGTQPGERSLVPVTALTEPTGEKADASFTLVAQQAQVRLQSGKTVDAWTYNGKAPGPELRLKQGQLVEITLKNKDIAEGVTLHWHGLDIPNAEDGVAGATQDAVMPGEEHTYRFRAEQAGTFWYHTHQQSKESVAKGLFGAIVVEPAQEASPPDRDITVLSHRWEGAGLAVGDADGVRRIAAREGERVKLRLIHTDDWVIQSYRLIGASFKVTAIDGTDLNAPGDLSRVRLSLPTGGRYDVTFTMPSRPVYLSVDGDKQTGILFSADGTGDIPEAEGPYADFDPTSYGQPADVPFHADSGFDREFEMVLDNEFGFYNGQFAAYDTINGEVFPNTPMFMVGEGDLVKVTVANRSAVEHPMHLHGHHMLVLSKNGEAVTGSPWWSDTLSVMPGDRYEVAFRADNPGLWMDHCHNLVHASAGMTMHLMYEGVTSPFTVGDASGNHPE